MRAVPQIALDFIIKEEGEVLRVYDDKRPQHVLVEDDEVIGVLTGGVGHTGALRIGQPVNRAQSRAWLQSDAANKVALPIERKIGAVVNELTENQYAALCSFVFNLGTGDPRKKEWTIWSLIRRRAFDQIPGQMVLFCNWNGKKSEALLARRNREAELWSRGEPGSVVTAPPSSVTRREATPPTITDPVPPHKSATIITGALGAVSTIPVAAKAITDAVEPYKDASPWIGQVIAIVATVAAASAVLVLVLNWLRKNRERTQ